MSSFPTDLEIANKVKPRPITEIAAKLGLLPEDIDLYGDGSTYLPVNRLLIKKGDYKQLVYYWFDQRGRKITNEYLVKWYLFWDALTRNRTDGSLVRLTTSLSPGEDPAVADARLVSFMKEVEPVITQYIPE